MLVVLAVFFKTLFYSVLFSPPPQRRRVIYRSRFTVVGSPYLRIFLSLSLSFSAKECVPHSILAYVYVMKCTLSVRTLLRTWKQRKYIHIISTTIYFIQSSCRYIKILDIPMLFTFNLNFTS